MKPTLQNRLFTAIAVSAIFLFTFSGCKKDQNPIDLKKTLIVNLTGGQEVPANASTGGGIATVVFDPVAKTITYNMSWALGFTASTTTNMHFHGMETGSDLVSSPVIIGITGFTTAYSGSISGVTRALTAVEEAQLLAGKWYLNIHSSLVSAGELRGNIKFP